MQKIELKPCPFCGSKARMFFDNYSVGYGVYCLRENEGLPCSAAVLAVYSDEEKAAEAWNRRANVQQDNSKPHN